MNMHEWHLNQTPWWLSDEAQKGRDKVNEYTDEQKIGIALFGVFLLAILIVAMI